MRVTRRYQRQFGIAAAVMLGLLAGGTAIANQKSVVQRQATMKDVAAQMKAASGFATGRTPWDPGKVKALMSAVSANAKRAKSHFTAAPTAGEPKTSALPAIWTRKADFNSRLDDMSRKALAAGNASNVASYRPLLQQLGGTCKGCHDQYRSGVN